MSFSEALINQHFAFQILSAELCHWLGNSCAFWTRAELEVHVLFLADVSFVCLFAVPYLGTAVLVCLDLFLKMVVLHSSGIAGWCELLGELLPARLFAFAGSIYFPGSCKYCFVFLASYLCSDVGFWSVKNSGIFFSAGFACLLGGSGFGITWFYVLLSVSIQMQKKCIKDTFP